MNQKLGRNDPCPCGSGQKYKRCCWHKEFTPVQEAKAHDGAIERAMRWLDERHRKAFRIAFNELFGELCGEEEQETLAQLDAPTLTGIHINLTEWLLAEGKMVVKGVRQRICDCLLGPGGPLFSVGQRDWLRQLSEVPLRLYDVTNVVPGAQITLCDALDAERAPIVVREHSGSQTLETGTKAAFRVMQVQDYCELSGAAYPFSMLASPDVAAKLQEAVATLGRESDLPSVLSRVIVRSWLRQYVAPPQMPVVMDAHSGDPIQLITDHYQVKDWASLTDTLAIVPDVQGNQRDGWAHLLNCDDGQTRSLAAINMGKRPDRIEIFYRTQRYADDGRAWFDMLAGHAVMYLTREIVHPSNALNRPSGRKAKPTTAPDIDPETLAQIIEQALRRSYANWVDEPIPALENQTPRQAMQTPAGLERVKGLLRGYEDSEERQAAAQGRREISYQFLWDALGVAPVSQAAHFPSAFPHEGSLRC